MKSCPFLTQHRVKMIATTLKANNGPTTPAQLAARACDKNKTMYETHPLHRGMRRSRLPDVRRHLLHRKANQLRGHLVVGLQSFRIRHEPMAVEKRRDRKQTAIGG